MSPELELSSKRGIIRILNIKREKISHVSRYTKKKNQPQIVLFPLNSFLFWFCEGECGHTNEDSKLGIHETRVSGEDMSV